MEKTCLNCKEVFTTNRSKRKFCSQKCYHNKKEESNKVKLICCHCGKEFRRSKGRVNDGKNYCSSECGVRSTHNQEIERVCNCCGNTYTAKTRNSKFCSSDCKNTHYNERKDRSGKCDRCSEWINYKANYNRAYDLICCDKCRGELKTIESLVGLKCDLCGKEFKRKKSRIYGIKNYCSTECQHNDSQEKTKRICSNCGKDVIRKKWDFKSYNGSGERKNVYCDIECMGEHYSKAELFAGENSPTWCGGKPKSYGTNWPRQRKRALERDNYKCQYCGISNKDYKDKTGIGLSVHHIKLYRLFNGDWEKANDLSNLTSLCDPCHKVAHRELKTT